MLKGVQTGLLWISLEDISQELLQKLQLAYTYEHPFEQSKSFETYVIHSGKIGLPYGNTDKLKQLLPPRHITHRTIAPTVTTPFEFKWELRDYQQDTHNQIIDYLSRGGTEFNLSGSCGSGKSVYLAALLAHLGVKTLVLAHMSMLTAQLHKEISESTTADVRLLSAKSRELGDVNIATSQFISQNPDIWYEIKHNIGCIVIDEAETLASKTTLRIVQRAHARYHIYISATFSRETDNRTDALTDFAGKARFVLDNSKVNIPVTVVMTKCSEMFPRFISKNTYVKAKQKFFKESSILDKIKTLSELSLAKGRQVLVAADIIELQNSVAEALQVHGVGILNSKTSKKSRIQILGDYDKGTIRVLIAAAVVNAGLSIPKISTIVRVSFPNSETKSVQLVGRAQRPLEGKVRAFVFDLVFRGQNPTKRVKAYKDNGFNVRVTNYEELIEGL